MNNIQRFPKLKFPSSYLVAAIFLGIAPVEHAKALQPPNCLNNPACLQSGRCGDGVCDSLEKEKGFCPEDCDESSNSQQETTTNIDLRTWSATKGGAIPGKWVVSKDGTSVVQQVDTYPGSMFLSRDKYIKTKFNGIVTVEGLPGKLKDMDFVGVVFGYKSPTDYYLFDWRNEEQGGAKEGMTLSKVSGSSVDLWKHTGAGMKVLATDYGRGKGYTPRRAYNFNIVYDSGKARIEVDGRKVFEISGTFGAGKFGFYDFSQENVKFQGFTATPTTELSCTDKLDNDKDGQVDCKDSDCAKTPECMLETNCTDKLDNDKDGLVDCKDSDCAKDKSCIGGCVCPQIYAPVCGVDSKTYSNGCAAKCAGVMVKHTGECETTIKENCTNGTDDDKDGQVDCKDSDCYKDSACVTNNISAPYYFIAIHNEPCNLGDRSGNCLSGSMQMLKQMIEQANNYNIKLTIMLSASDVDFITPEDISSWKSKGHEIAAHHHGLHHGNWDGYTNYSIDDACKIRPNYSLSGTCEQSYGTMNDYINKLYSIDNEIMSGCMNDESLKLDNLPDQIVYDTCSGYSNEYSHIGQKVMDGDAGKGVNEFILSATVNNIERKWLTHSQNTDSNKSNAILQKFDSLNKDIVYGVVNHSSNNELEYFNNYLEKLHKNDPTGSKSRTISEVMEQGLLPVEKVDIAID